MAPFIIALIAFIIFCLWLLFAFKVIWIALIINGIPLLLIALRSYRDLKHYREYRLYIGSAAVSLVVLALFIRWFRQQPLLLFTDFVVVTFALVYLAKLCIEVDKRYNVIKRIRRLANR